MEVEEVARRRGVRSPVVHPGVDSRLVCRGHVLQEFLVVELLHDGLEEACRLKVDVEVRWVAVLQAVAEVGQGWRWGAVLTFAHRA